MRACVPADLGLIGFCEGNRPVKCSLGSVKRGTHATVKPVVKTTRGGRLVDAGTSTAGSPILATPTIPTLTGSGFFLNTYSRATGLGQALTRTGLHAKSAQVLVEKCPTCGSIKIYWNGSLKHTYSLKASRVLKKIYLSAVSFSSVRVGMLKIVVSSTGKPVIINGLGVSAA